MTRKALLIVSAIMRFEKSLGPHLPVLHFLFQYCQQENVGWENMDGSALEASADGRNDNRGHPKAL
jgi:hypothetical protein